MGVTTAFTFPAKQQQQQQQSPCGSVWAAQPFTAASASPFSPAKTVFGPGPASTANTSTNSTFNGAWGGFPPASSGAAAAISTTNPFAPATSTGSNGGFCQGNANASTFQYNQGQANPTSMRTFGWNPQPSTHNPFTTAGADSNAVGAQQSAANPFAGPPAWSALRRSPADRFMHIDPPVMTSSMPTFTWARQNAGQSNDATRTTVAVSVDPTPGWARPQPPPNAAPTPAWTFPSTSKSPWSFPSATTSTETKAPQSTWTFPLSTNSSGGGVDANASSQTAPASANNGFKFTWTPSVTANNAGTNVATTAFTSTLKFQWPTTTTATVATPPATTTTTTTAPPASQLPAAAAPQSLVAQADVDPYGAGSFGAGLVEQQVKAALGSSKSASTSASNTDRSTEVLSLTPTRRHRSPPLAQRVGLSPSATISRPKQPMMLLQRLSGSRSSWARNEFRLSGSPFHR